MNGLPLMVKLMDFPMTSGIISCFTGCWCRTARQILFISISDTVACYIYEERVNGNLSKFAVEEGVAAL